MIEIFTAVFTFWNYVEATTIIKKIWMVSSKYFNFIQWYIKNPEVQIKYVKVITKKKSKDPIGHIYQNLVDHNKKFGDGFIKDKYQLNFELIDSKLNYRIILDELNNQKENIKIETKYMPFYPLRKFKKLNGITNEFNSLYEIISNPFKIYHANSVIRVEIEVETDNKELKKFEKLGAEIIFKNKKIQINNFHGTEQGEFLLFFVMKWLTEYR
jgi:hypothetical protein